MNRRSLYPLWGSLHLQRGSGISLQEQIVSFYRRAIRERHLPGGMQVRSSRQFAADYGISRTTAVQAYEKLVGEGYLVSKPGAGVFVATVSPEAFRMAPAVAQKRPRISRSRKRGALAKQPIANSSLGTTNAHLAGMPADLSRIDGRRYELPLAPGMPAFDQFPWNTWARISNQVLRERPLNALGYGDPQGEVPLREAVAEYLAGARGIVCSPSQIVIVSGTEQLIEFVASQLAGRGHSVWFEDPSYPFVRRVLRSGGFNAVAVKVDDAGICIADGLLRAPTARVAVVSPTHQYPLGVTMTLQRRQELIDWSRHSGSWIIENEIDGDYLYTPDPIPPLYTLADTDRVIYCGSLSKPLAPGLRVNYFVGPSAAINSFALRSTLVPMFTQLVLARFNADGYLASHMNKMRRLYSMRRAILIDALRAEAKGLLDFEFVPQAGLRIPVELLTRQDDTKIAAECRKSGIQVDPMSVCYEEAPRRAGLILGFASTPEQKLRSAVHALTAILAR